MQKYERLLCIVIPVLLILSSCKKDDGDIPVVSTSEVVGVTSYIAICGGNITSDGGAAITERGVCWSTSETPIISDNKSTGGTGAGSFTCNIKGLTGNTTYYIAAYATNSAGTGYGEIKSFTTPPTVTDIDGNTYSTVVIGTQTWMAENLKTTSYNNGDPITYISDWYHYDRVTENAEYCDYDIDGETGDIYGNFYNWYAVSDDRGIAPEGWHVPTIEEWTTLIDYLGGIDNAGEKMKETGNLHWAQEWGGGGGTNTSGFTALAAGFAGDNHRFYDARFWAASEESEDQAHYIYVDLVNLVMLAHANKVAGYSVRCVKDQ